MDTLKSCLKGSTFISLICAFSFLSCQTISPTRLIDGGFKDLGDYKKMTKYIVENDLQNGYKGDSIIERSNADSILADFMKKRGIMVIQIIRGTENPKDTCHDCLVQYRFFHVPIFGKGKELTFDFTSDPPMKSERSDGTILKVLEKGVYYLKY